MIALAVIGGIILILFQLLGPVITINILLVIVGAILAFVYYIQDKIFYNPCTPFDIQPPQIPPNSLLIILALTNTLLKSRLMPKTLPSRPRMDLLSEDGISKIKTPNKSSSTYMKVLEVYFYLYHTDIGTRLPLVNQLVNKTNSEVILVAYRGYSDSDGVPSEEGLEKDAEAILKYAIDYCQSKNPQMNLVLYGRALGGAVAIYLASHKDYKDKIQGLIV